MLGASWMTSLVGYAVMVLTVVHQVFTEHGLPDDVAGWIKFGGGILTGVGLALAKDFNKSNAPNPERTAQPVT